MGGVGHKAGEGVDCGDSGDLVEIDEGDVIGEGGLAFGARPQGGHEG